MSRTGFTTIEMVIVVILIGLIAAIGIPRLKGSMERQNLRSSKAAIATMVATARATAIQRGCAARLHLSADSLWVTACGVNPPASLTQVGTGKPIALLYNVTLASSAATITYDPRGLATEFQTRIVRIVGPTYRDSVIINQLGKVIRQ